MIKMAVDDEEQQTKVTTKLVLLLLPGGTSICTKYTLIVYNVNLSVLLPRFAGSVFCEACYFDVLMST